MDKEDKKKDFIVGVSAAVGSTLSSKATESMVVKNDTSDEMEVNMEMAVPQQADISTDETSEVSTASPPSTNEESVVTIVPPKENVQPISPDDIIADPEPVMYGGPVIDDEDLVVIGIDSDIYGGPVNLIVDPDVIDDEFVIDIDSNMYGSPVEDIEPTMYGGPMPEDLEPIDIDSDIYGGPVDII